MTAKEYLQQPYLLDKAINAKLAHYDQVKALATKTTTTLTGMPGGGGVSDKVGDGAVKLADYAMEINGEIDRYVDMKREVANWIAKVDNTDLRAILEHRHLAYQTWEQIAVDMNYTYRHIHRLHAAALQAFWKIHSVELMQMI